MKYTLSITIATVAAVSLHAASVDPASLGTLVDLATYDASRISANPSDGWVDRQTPLNAFNGNYSDRTSRYHHPYTVAYTFPSAVVVNSYCVASEADAVNRAPGEWKFRGSNDFDGSNFDSATWAELDSQSGETGWSNGERRYYVCGNSTAYKTYALTVTDNSKGDKGSALFSELDLFYAGCEVSVVGNPGNYGDTDYSTAKEPYGSSVSRSTFSGEWVDAQGTISVKCSGYRLFTSDNGADWTLWQSGTGSTVEFVAPRSLVKVEWLYAVTRLVEETAVYVSPTGSDSNAGDTPSSAFATISHAVSELGENGGIVYLADGTYSEPNLAENEIVLSTPVKIIGMSGDPSKVTVKPKNVNCRVFSMTHSESQLRYITVSGLGSTTSTDNMEGVAVNMSAGEMLDCVVTGTFHRNGGSKGSVYMSGGHVARCHFKKCYVRGAGLCVYATGGIIEDCLFSGNAWEGNNDGTFMVDLEGPATLLNCTVTDNHMRADSGVKAGTANSRVINCIIYGNTSLNSLTGHVWGGNASCFVNCVTEIEIPGAVNCITENPDFVNPNDGDYRITCASPAFDAGSERPAASISTTDKDGRQRVVGNGVDIGCFEHQQETFECAFEYSLAKLTAPVEVSFTAHVVNPGEGAVEYTWLFGDESTDYKVDNPSASHVYTTGGTFDVTLRVTAGGATVERIKAGTLHISPAVLYVSPENASAAEPYDTAEKAAPNLATAVAYAEDGAEVLMLPGKYEQQNVVKIEKAIRVLGSTGRPSDVIMTNTVHNSDRRVLEMHNSRALVAGVTLTDGRSFSNNGHGGTLFFNNGGGTVSNCIIRSGSASGWASYAGAVGMNNGLLTHCTITGSFSSDPAANGNSSEAGLVVYMNGVNARMENCLIRDVSANMQMAAQTESSKCIGPLVGVRRGLVANCTIAVSFVQDLDVPSTMTFDGGSALYVSTSAYAYNCVATGFRRADGTSVPFSGSTKFYGCAGDAAVDGINAIVGTPESFYENPAAGKYRPLGGGPLVNAGTAVALSASTDLDGNPRILKDIIDIGCYERQPLKGLSIHLR